MQGYFIYDIGACRLKGYICSNSYLFGDFICKYSIFYRENIFFLYFYQFNAYYFSNDLQVAHNDSTFENIHGLFNRSRRSDLFEHELGERSMTFGILVLIGNFRGAIL